MKKGQVSTEFLIVIGVILLIFATISFFSLSRRADVRETETYLGATDECLKFSNLISAAYVNGDGTEIRTKTNYIASIFKSREIYVESRLHPEEAKLAYYCCQAAESCFLRGELEGKLEFDPYMGSTKGINPQITDLLSKIDQYDIVILEDPHLKDVDITKLDEFVFNGGTVIISEHTEQRLFGVNKTGGGGDNPATVINVDQRLNLSLSDELNFGQKVSIKVSEVTIENFKVIANYSETHHRTENLAAIAIWNYGPNGGEVSYFSDFDELTETIDFPALAVDYIKQVINLLGDHASRVTCTYVGAVQFDGKFTGDLLIKNVDNEIIIENVATS